MKERGDKEERILWMDQPRDFETPLSFYEAPFRSFVRRRGRQNGDSPLVRLFSDKENYYFF